VLLSVRGNYRQGLGSLQHVSIGFGLVAYWVAVLVVIDLMWEEVLGVRVPRNAMNVTALAAVIGLAAFNVLAARGAQPQK
jgi:hypothetical protein